MGPAVCVEARSDDRTTSGHEDAEPPPPGGIFFYLAACDDGSRSMTYGSAHAGRPRIVTGDACR